VVIADHVLGELTECPPDPDPWPPPPPTPDEPPPPDPPAPPPPELPTELLINLKFLLPPLEMPALLLLLLLLLLTNFPAFRPRPMLLLWWCWL